MLKLYNTMTRSQEAFQPRSGKQVKIFTCGPSIYRRPHLGNYRTFLYEDILIRYLEYLGYQVQRVINFTDVEDKMITEAAAQNLDAEKIAAQVAGHFFRETELLHIKLPAMIPRSSTTVDQAAELIQRLIAKGHAYWHGGDVFFDPLKFKGFGKLFRLDLNNWPEQKVRFKRDTYVGRRWNRGDFILWHGYKNGDAVYWDTSIGKGRPSWNIQDPAIITQHLGYTVDINCGGIDNIYRHHDYNIAVIESVSGEDYANYYLHGEHLIVDGRVMSKSRGNILYPLDIINDACNATHLRFFLIYQHYRRKLNYTEKSFHRNCARLESFQGLVKRLGQPGKGPVTASKRSSPGRPEDGRVDSLIRRIGPEFEARMNDDLAVGAAFDRVFTLLQEIDRSGASLNPRARANLHSQLKKIDAVLQVGISCS